MLTLRRVGHIFCLHSPTLLLSLISLTKSVLILLKEDTKVSGMKHILHTEKRLSDVPSTVKDS